MKELNKGIGIWQILNSNLITDIIASAKFDFVLIDLEHGLHSLETIQNCVFTASASGMKTIVRFPSIDFEEVVQVIETGIDGVLFPHIETKNDVERIIKKTFLPPIGDKSYSPFVSKYNYGLNMEIHHNEPSLGLLIESLLGINNLPILLKNKNVKFVYFGAYDLSLELKIPGQIFHPKIIDNLKILIKNAHSEDKRIMSIYRNNEELKKLINLGVDLPISSVDTFHLANKLNNETSYYKEIKNSDFF